MRGETICRAVLLSLICTRIHCTQPIAVSLRYISSSIWTADNLNQSKYSFPRTQVFCLPWISIVVCQLVKLLRKYGGLREPFKSATRPNKLTGGIHSLRQLWPEPIIAESLWANSEWNCVFKQYPIGIHTFNTHWCTAMATSVFHCFFFLSLLKSIMRFCIRYADMAN